MKFNVGDKVKIKRNLEDTYNINTNNNVDTKFLKGSLGREVTISKIVSEEDKTYELAEFPNYLCPEDCLTIEDDNDPDYFIIIVKRPAIKEVLTKIINEYA